MSARMESMISRLGESVTVYKQSLGKVDDYGDKAETWTSAGSETVIIVPLTQQRLNEYASVLGRLKEVEKLAYTKVGSVAVEGTYLSTNLYGKYRVMHCEPVVLGGIHRFNLLFLSQFT